MVNPALQDERRRFIARTTAIPAWRSRTTQLTAGLDRLIEWSALHSHAIEFAHGARLEQDSLCFIKRSDGRVFWKAYPASRQGDPKVELLTRVETYAIPEILRELSQRWDFVVTRPHSPEDRRVMSLPLLRLADQVVWDRLRSFLDWAIDEHRLH